MDTDLIEKCKKGDPAALEQLYSMYASRMKGICLRYAASNFEAEDIFQEAFIKILLNLKNYKDTGSFTGWIKTIVVNTAIDHLDKNKIFRGHLSSDDIEETVFSDTIEAAASLLASDLLAVIDKIPSGYKEIFNLYAIEGYSHAEISVLLNITESTSRSQLSKARNYIRKILDHHYHLPDIARNKGNPGEQIPAIPN